MMRAALHTVLRGGLGALALLLALGGTARADDCSAAVPGGINFGNVSPISSTDLTATGTLNVTCNWNALISIIINGVPILVLQFPNVQVCVSLGLGSNSSTSTAVPRSMGTVLNYNLYTDPGYGTVWGGASASGAPTPATALLVSPGTGPTSTATKAIPIYGKIPAGAALAGVATVGNAPTVYSSTFSGAAVTLSYQFYALITPPACPVFNTATTTTFVAQATVIDNCNINVGNLGFGSSSLLTGPLRTTSALSIQCTNNNSYQIALNGGNTANNVAGRKMKNTSTAETVNYQISPTLDGAIWGDGTGSTVMVTGVGTGAPQSVTLYGMVPAQSTPSPGVYNDQVTATVSF